MVAPPFTAIHGLGRKSYSWPGHRPQPFDESRAVAMVDESPRSVLPPGLENDPKAIAAALEEGRAGMEAHKQPFWFIRHGETEANVEGLALGRADIPLTAHGQAQATACGQACAALFKDAKDAATWPFNHIVCSPMMRAWQTAWNIVQAIKAAGGPELPIRYDPDLTEVNFGPMEGKSLSDNNWFEAWANGAPLKNGESRDLLALRALRGLSMAACEGKGSFLLVGHGAWFRALRFGLGMAPGQAVGAPVPNATPIHMEPTPQGWREKVMKAPGVVGAHD
ncbi:histidine phosphatase family protein [Formicincola oecophyllae]|nr:histidine phosphatase family protein [Formicincola oecophyllae]